MFTDATFPPFLQRSVVSMSREPIVTTIVVVVVEKAPPNFYVRIYLAVSVSIVLANGSIPLIPLFVRDHLPPCGSDSKVAAVCEVSPQSLPRECDKVSSPTVP